MFADAEALAEGAARELAAAAQEAQASRGSFRLVLAGGSTPKGLYEVLAREPYRSGVNWSRVEVFWGDERCVQPDAPESNYAMAWASLLSRVSIAREGVHRIHGELEPRRGAEHYEQLIRKVTGESHPRFDLVLLGLGTDGHTASLFPDTPRLLEDQRLARATRSPRPPNDRITLTLGVLNSARLGMFLVQGAEKASILREVMGATEEEASSLPAARVRPRDGRLLWLVDRAAAGG